MTMQMIKRISVASTLIGSLAVLGVVFSFSALFAGKTVNASGEYGYLPSGAVVAFNSASCPDGWSQFTQANGRMIIGTGNSYTNGAYNHPLLEQGGNESHTLSIAELPKFRLAIPWSAQNTGGARGQQPDPLVAGGVTYTNPIGQGKSHNIMDPYVTLLYCVRN